VENFQGPVNYRGLILSLREAEVGKSCQRPDLQDHQPCKATKAEKAPLQKLQLTGEEWHDVRRNINFTDVHLSTSSKQERQDCK
ncbi:hypothetical protein HGM15179_003034, partial [Zosterops borbonicus]